MIPTEMQIREVVRNIWSTQLGILILDVDPLQAPTGEDKIKTMTAAIHIGGNYRGGVLLECSQVHVRKAAAIMFGQPKEQLGEADDRDVIGELTNVVAGNIKALIPGTNDLSLPTIIEGADYRVSSTDVRSIEHVGFSVDGEIIVVTVLEHL